MFVHTLLAGHALTLRACNTMLPWLQLLLLMCVYCKLQCNGMSNSRALTCYFVQFMCVVSL
jgi:hypothetical protein